MTKIIKTIDKTFKEGDTVFQKTSPHLPMIILHIVNDITCELKINEQCIVGDFKASELMFLKKAINVHLRDF